MSFFGKILTKIKKKNILEKSYLQLNFILMTDFEFD